MMTKASRRFYLISLGVLLAMSAYPVAMGLKIIVLQLLHGSIRPQDYTRYVIPYTAICLGVLASAALYPVFSRLKKWAVPLATITALCLFTGIELLIEGIVRPALMIQLFSCVYTPTATLAFRGVYDDSYKIHYFLVSFILITLVTGVFYGYGRLFSGGDRSKRIPLAMQAIMAALLLCLCVFANFTGFFREKTDYQTPISAFLTGLFFVVMSAAAGIYSGSGLIEKGKALSVGLTAAAAMIICSIMYYGEYSMFGDTLYRFGKGWFFEGLPWIALAPIDMLIILLAGATAAGAMAVAGKATPPAC
jgi:hypothetical protein